MKKKVFISRNIIGNPKKLLEDAGFDVILNTSNDPLSSGELISLSQDSHAILSMLDNTIDKKFIENCSKLEVISNYAVGFNNIDTSFAKEKNIAVGNTPGVLSEATAQTALTLLLCCSRRAIENNEYIKSGNWNSWSPTHNLGLELKGKTLGIFGMGRIGFEFASKCFHAFNMNILYTARSEKTYATKINAKKVGLDYLLENSDVISIHCDLNDTTRKIFNKVCFSKMKQDSILINTARGEIVDENDLIDALKNGKLFAAGLDVTDPEPIQINNPLLKMKNVTIFPHIGSATIETRTIMTELACQNIISALNKTGPFSGPVSIKI